MIAERENAPAIVGNVPSQLSKIERANTPGIAEFATIFIGNRSVARYRVRERLKSPQRPSSRFEK